MSCICRRFAEGGKPYSASSLRYETGIPIRVVNDLLLELMKAGLIVELTSDEKGDLPFPSCGGHTQPYIGCDD